jgi:glucose-6-phosphate 1-dehydrogenase
MTKVIHGTSTHIPAHAVTEKPLPPCNIIIFGATGDLTHRKLMPALFSIYGQGLLSEQMHIIGFARREFSDHSYRDEIKESVEKFAPDIWKEYSEKWHTFSERIFFHRSEFDSVQGYKWLKERLDDLDRVSCTDGNRLFYLATPPSNTSEIVKQIANAGLSKPGPNRKSKDSLPDAFARIIVEKPFGTDLDSAKALNAELKAVFHENQIYRIDHYLGKETVQNILVFRFANAIFEPIWNQKYIDNIQVMVAETVGVENRAGYFDHAGELRDMVQSHAMQLLTLVAMEPPVSLSADSIRDEKVKVLKSLRPIAEYEVEQYTVRAQYEAGMVDNVLVPGYLQESGVNPDSETDTYVAVKVEVQNWRWAGVPFYIRAGKRMPKRATEINIQFKNIPGILFAHMASSSVEPNLLTIRIQPDEGISIRLGSKPPGPRMKVESVDLDMTYGNAFGSKIHDAYERLLMDAMLGEAALFTRDDEVEAEWAFITPILKAWAASETMPLDNYNAGTWGPDSSVVLLDRDSPGRRWWDR